VGAKLVVRRKRLQNKIRLRRSTTSPDFFLIGTFFDRDLAQAGIRHKTKAVRAAARTACLPF